MSHINTPSLLQILKLGYQSYLMEVGSILNEDPKFGQVLRHATEEEIKVSSYFVLAIL